MKYWKENHSALLTFWKPYQRRVRAAILRCARKHDYDVLGCEERFLDHMAWQRIEEGA